MNYQHLKNFMTNRVRKNDVYVPSMVLFLVKNEGIGNVEEIAKLIYIFENRYDLNHYEKIVRDFASHILEDYNMITRENDTFKLNTWPLNNKEIENIVIECHKVSNGFFKNLHEKQEQKAKDVY